jgi:hypothetical protein
MLCYEIWIEFSFFCFLFIYFTKAQFITIFGSKRLDTFCRFSNVLLRIWECHAGILEQYSRILKCSNARAPIVYVLIMFLVWVIIILFLLCLFMRFINFRKIVFDILNCNFWLHTFGLHRSELFPSQNTYMNSFENFSNRIRFPFYGNKKKLIDYPVSY